MEEKEGSKKRKREDKKVQVLCANCQVVVEEATSISRTKAYIAQKQREYRARKKQKLMQEKLEQELMDQFVEEVLEPQNFRQFLFDEEQGEQTEPEIPDYFDESDVGDNFAP